MNNATFGKTMENVRKRIRFELVNNETRFKKLVNDHEWESNGCNEKKICVKLDKPIAIGVLDLSKLLMYDYHYNTIKKQSKW